MLGPEIDMPRVVVAQELPEAARDAAVWASLQTHRQAVNGEGAWDATVWGELQHPRDPVHPVPLFLVEPRTGRVSLIPHIGATGLEGLKAS